MSTGLSTGDLAVKSIQLNDPKMRMTADHRRRDNEAVLLSVLVSTPEHHPVVLEPLLHAPDHDPVFQQHSLSETPALD